MTPPVVFSVLLAAVLLLYCLLGRLSFKPKSSNAEACKSYACGEDVPTHLMQPDYTQFFPFAFFFTILHVVALTVATVPVETPESFGIAVLYIGGAFSGLTILLRR